MSEQTTDNFMTFGEKYEDGIPSGDFGPLTNIGHASTYRAYKVWVAEDYTDEGEFNNDTPQARGRGFHYFVTDKETVDAYAKKYLGDKTFPTRSLVTQMAVASIINMANENRTKFPSGLIAADCRFSGIPKDWASPETKSKNFAGLGLVAEPSMVDAYARAKGWYVKPLFDPTLAASTTTVADAGAIIAQLVEQRKTLWAALGEKADNWRTSDVKKTSAKLGEAIDKMLNHSWRAWARMATVLDPSPGAYYTSTDENGDVVAKRQRCQIVLELFPSEKVAQDVGLKELAEYTSGGGDTNPSASATAPALFDLLSDGAKAMYGDTDTFSTVVEDIRELLSGRLPEVAKLNKAASDYGLTVADVAEARKYLGMLP